MMAGVTTKNFFRPYLSVHSATETLLSRASAEAYGKGRNEGAHVPANQPNTRDPKTAPAMYTVPMMPTCCEEMPKAAAFVTNQTQPVMSAITNAAGDKSRRCVEALLHSGVYIASSEYRR
jgi:hypothetical protein